MFSYLIVKWYTYDMTSSRNGVMALGTQSKSDASSYFFHGDISRTGLYWPGRP